MTENQPDKYLTILQRFTSYNSPLVRHLLIALNSLILVAVLFGLIDNLLSTTDADKSKMDEVDILYGVYLSIISGLLITAYGLSKWIGTISCILAVVFNGIVCLWFCVLLLIMITDSVFNYVVPLIMLISLSNAKVILDNYQACSEQ